METFLLLLLSPMKIISWNVQGAKKPHFQQEVRFINGTIKPDILVFLETIVNECNTARIVKSLGYQFYDTIPPKNHVGGIWLLWSTENMKVNAIAKETRALHYLVYEKSTSKQCVLSTVSVPAQNQEKNDFWDHLKHLNDVINLPWFLMGDFNEMLISSNKIGGSPLTVSKTQRLLDFLAYSKGIGANVDGRIFNWKNFCEGN